MTPKLMYVGTTGGAIFRSRDAGRTWSQSLSSVNIPSRAITCIHAHPKFAETVAMTLASTGVLGPEWTSVQATSYRMDTSSNRRTRDIPGRIWMAACCRTW